MRAYYVLGVSSSANDQQIRAAYLALTKVFSPDRFPQRFAEISRAYEQIKSCEARRDYLLFGSEDTAQSPFDALRDAFRNSAVRPRLSAGQIIEFLRRDAMI